MEGDAIVSAGKIFVTTNLAAAVATVTVMMITWIRYKKPDVSMSLNGSLAGLVAITAGCDTVSPASAAIIGIAAGFVVVFGIEFIDKVLKVDDPVGAVGVHGLNEMCIRDRPDSSENPLAAGRPDSGTPVTRSASTG